MNDTLQIGNLTREELDKRINDCRIRILEELGLPVPDILKSGDK